MVVLLILSTTAISQEKPPSAPGRMVDIGGYSLYLNCTGHGGPTVVLENGLGDVSTTWSLVQPKISKYAQVCSYDRAYDGFSDGGPIPWTFHQEVFETHQLLRAAGIEPPYILVGNSVGGLLNQLYKNIYPDEVAGIVLVDSTHVDTVMGPGPLRKIADGTPVPMGQTMADAPPPPLTKEEQEIQDRALANLAKQNEAPLPHPYDLIPPQNQPVYRWEHSHPKLPPSVPGPHVNWWANEMQQMYIDRQRKVDVYRDMPLLVLAAQDSATNPERLRQVNDMVQMSTNSILIIDTKADHNMQLTSPDLVVWSIRRVLDSVHSHSKLDDIKE
jgi:pimeloyl-ACP methyl ester carboxylesterase